MAKRENNDSGLVPFALSKIQTLEFAILEKSYSQNEEVQITQEFNFSVDPLNKQVGIAPRHEYIQQSPFLILEVRCVFTIAEVAWNKWMDTAKGTFTLPRNIATHMAVLSVGTARGVLHAKTEGNYFNMFVLPTWNLSKVILDDFVIALEDQHSSQ